MAKKASSKTSVQLSRSLRVYQKASIAFVIVSFLLLLVVLYLSVSRATIHIEPVVSKASTAVTVTVTPDPTEEGQVNGYVFEQVFEKGKTFTLPEEGATEVEAKAQGVVTLINETGSAQPLVATTRVLTKEGILFRLDNPVTVPAGGQVQAAVTADQPGASGNIGPAQFTIPGLAPSLQSTIYAVSEDKMVGGIQFVRTLAQADIDQAEEELKAELLDEAKTAFKDLLPTDVFNGDTYVTRVTSSTINAEVGEQVGAFTLTMTAQVTAIYYDKQVITAYVEQQLYNELQDGRELLAVNEEGLQADVANVNVENESAELDLSLEGTVIIAPTSDALRKERLTGKSAKEIMALLEVEEEIESVSVTFTPFWLKRTPTLQDHIDIRIKKPSKREQADIESYE